MISILDDPAQALASGEKDSATKMPTVPGEQLSSNLLKGKTQTHHETTCDSRSRTSKVKLNLMATRVLYE
ncbi:11011_t:CDS:1, partial [Paraglomus occultum]